MKGIAVMHGLSPLTDEYAMISIVHKGNTTSHMYYYFTNPHVLILQCPKSKTIVYCDFIYTGYVMPLTRSVYWKVCLL